VTARFRPKQKRFHRRERQICPRCGCGLYELGRRASTMTASVETNVQCSECGFIVQRIRIL
jgi:RNase P subunit RPR2